MFAPRLTLGELPTDIDLRHETLSLACPIHTCNE